MENKRKAGAPPLRRRVGALLAAGLIASCMAAPAAFAVDPSTGDMSGSGATAMKVKVDSGTEYSPSDQEASYNTIFKVPTKINYVVKASGDLIGPDDAEVQNYSAIPSHVSGMKVEAAEGWKIVKSSEFADSTDPNTVHLAIGPEGAQADAGAFLNEERTKFTDDNVTNLSKWNIPAYNGSAGTLTVKSGGAMKNINEKLAWTSKKFGTMQWWITTGSAPSASGN